MRIQGWQVLALAAVLVMIVLIVVTGVVLITEAQRGNTPALPTLDQAAQPLATAIVRDDSTALPVTATLNRSTTLQPTVNSTTTGASTIAPTSLPDVTITLNTDSASGQVAADNRSTVTVTAVVKSKTRSIDGLTMYFNVSGGGSVEPNQVAIQNGVAVTRYTAGSAGSTSEVLLVAVVDVPNVGRISGVKTITLVRQTLSLDLPCGYGIAGSEGDIPVMINAAPEAPVGLYQLRVRVERGELSTDQGQISQLSNQQSGQLFDVVTTPGLLTFHFRAPTKQGDSRICISYPDRPSVPESCGLINWGAPVSRLQMHSSNRSYWELNTSPEVRFNALDGQGTPLSTTAAVSYQIVASTQPDAKLSVFKTTDARSEWPVSSCIALDTSTKQETQVVYLTNQIASIARWRLVLPGTPPVVNEWVTIQSAQPLRLVKSAAKFMLADGSTLQFQAAANDPSFVLYSASAYNPKRPTSTVIIKFYVPDDAIDQSNSHLRSPNKGTLDAVSTQTAYSQLHKPNLVITLNPNNAFVLHTGSDIMEGQTNTDNRPTQQATSRWRLVYAQAEIATTAVQPWN